MSQPAYDTPQEDTTAPVRRLGHNLPIHFTPLIGRGPEVQAVAQRLGCSDVRLMTLVGPPGIGKTRLSIQVATELVPKFSHGVYFVNLAPVTNPDMVLSAVAQVLGVETTQGQSQLESLVALLRGKELLLLLDNFEQVVEAAPLLAELLTACLGLKLLVTSREVLHLSAEHTFSVPPLSLPPAIIHQGAPGRFAAPSGEQLAEYEAVQLFVGRAKALVPNFALDGENSYAVAAICRKLDGLPLAIELAAARIRHLPPSEILGQLGTSLQLLTGGPRDLPLRHQTLRATIEWSYDLLSEAERQLFQRLAIFSGGATLEAITAICNVDAAFGGSTLEVVASLLDKSLLQQQPESRPSPRYTMLETIREYAWQKLQESSVADAVRKQRTNFYLTLAEQSESGIYGPAQLEWLERLEADHDNLRAALEWCSTRQGEEQNGLRLAGALFRFWDLRGHLTEGRHWLREMLAIHNIMLGNSLEDSDDKVLQGAVISALIGWGVLSYKQGYIEQSEAPLQEAVMRARRLGDSKLTGRSLHNLGALVYNRGDYAAALAIQKESLELARKEEDHWYAAACLVALGSIASEQGQYQEARSLLEQALATSRRLGCLELIANQLRFLGFFMLSIGEYAQAQPLLEESKELWQRLGNKAGTSWALLGLGHVALHSGDPKEAESLAQKSLVLARELGAQSQTAWAFACLGNISLRNGERSEAVELFKQGLTSGKPQFAMLNNSSCLVGLATALVESNPRAAVILLGAVEAQREHLAARMWQDTKLQRDSTLEIARRHMSSAAFAEAYSTGLALAPLQATEFAHTLDYSDVPSRPTVQGAARRAGTLSEERLTRREQAVAVLIAEGRSNRQIAHEMVVSERTVEGHISNILSKLGFRSRTQITAWVLREGLLSRPH